jgi:predicted transcriptional regulator
MSLIEDYGLFEPERKLILLALSVPDERNVTATDILHLNKILKLYQETTKSEEIEFSNYNLGAVSFDVQEDLDNLEEMGLIERNNKEEYNLTKEGKSVINDLKNTVNKEKYDQLIQAKKILNDLPYDEILFYMYKRFPQTQINSTQYRRLKTTSKVLINKLLNKSKINQTTAFQWLIES